MSLEWAQCHKCKAKLFRARLAGDSVVEIKCQRCSALNTVSAASLSDLVPDGRGGFLPAPRSERGIALQVSGN